MAVFINKSKYELLVKEHQNKLITLQNELLTQKHYVLERENDKLKQENKILNNEKSNFLSEKSKLQKENYKYKTDYVSLEDDNIQLQGIITVQENDMKIEKNKKQFIDGDKLKELTKLYQEQIELNNSQQIHNSRDKLKIQQLQNSIKKQTIEIQTLKSEQDKTICEFEPSFWKQPQSLTFSKDNQIEKQDLEKQDLEKQDLEKQDLEKQDLEKQDLEKQELLEIDLININLIKVKEKLEQLVREKHTELSMLDKSKLIKENIEMIVSEKLKELEELENKKLEKEKNAKTLQEFKKANLIKARQCRYNTVLKKKETIMKAQKDYQKKVLVKKKLAVKAQTYYQKKVLVKKELAVKAQNAYQMKVLEKKELVVKAQSYYQKKVLEKKDKIMKAKENIAIKQKIILENRGDNYDIYLISKPDIHTFHYNKALSEFMKQNYVISIKLLELFCNLIGNCKKYKNLKLNSYLLLGMAKYILYIQSQQPQTDVTDTINNNYKTISLNYFKYINVNSIRFYNTINKLIDLFDKNKYDEIEKTIKEIIVIISNKYYLNIPAPEPSASASHNKRPLENEDTNECSKKHKLDEKEPTPEVMLMTCVSVNDENVACSTEIDDIVFISSKNELSDLNTN